MQVPLEVSFRHMEHSAEVEAQVRERADKLDQFFDRITSGTVVVEAAHQHQRTGNLYHVRIRLAVPRGEIAVDREPAEHQAHEDLHVTVRDAFDEAERQLQDYVRKLRGNVKTHDVPPHGRIARLFPEEGYGFIETADGRDVYFHENSLLKTGIEQLEVGEEVRFVEEEGEKGPQATSVRQVGRHHHLSD